VDIKIVVSKSTVYVEDKEPQVDCCHVPRLESLQRLFKMAYNRTCFRSGPDGCVICRLLSLQVALDQ
jgi:hypothetical protein